MRTYAATSRTRRKCRTRHPSFVPFAALNYLSGLTAVRTSSYFLATVIGILPATTAYVAVGAYGNEPGSLPFLAAIGALVMLTVVGVVVSRRRRDGASDATATVEC